MMMSDKLQKFTDLMQSIFELDKSDLDFGIYRIMNIRKAEIEKFLKVDLVKKVQDTLAPFASNTDEIEARIAEIEKTCDAVGIEVSASKMADEYATLKAQLLAGVDMSALETDVYSALYSFFNRYYDEGDFISKRRYKEGVYSIPYEGEEVKLYWANQDQYYIKTTENFKDYTFKDGGLTVHFQLVDATMEQNNNKESEDNKRVFMLYEETEEHPDIKTYELIGNELIIRFVFDVSTDKKKKHAEENAAKIVEAITKQYKEFFPIITPRFMDSKTKKQTKSLLDKHLEAYVAKNTFDYFIHKDLRGFLTRELDFYIKSEIIHLDDLDTTNEKRVETYLAKVKAIKRVGNIIINFLAQIENFQKKLWLKKKFVVETNWCITLDKIDEVFYQEIIENKCQIQDWIDMYAIDEIQGDTVTVGYSDPLTIDFLRQNQNLIVDTKHLTMDLKDRLLVSIDNIDKQTDGLMIRSENFQALNLIEKRYKGCINYCYIDPPYNTDSTPILYKNGYRDSSWLSLMNDRLIVSQQFLTERGVYTVAIDDTEVNELSLLLSQVFTNHRISPITVVHNPKGSPTKDFNRIHEYAIFVTGEGVRGCIARIMEENDKPRKMRRWGENSLRTERKLSFYPIYIKNGKIIEIGTVPVDDYHPAGKNEIQADGSIAVWPIDQNGIERRWNFGLDTIRDNLDRITILEDDGIYDLFLTHEMTIPKTVWKGGEYDAGSHGNTLLTNIIGEKLFDFPKSIHTVKRCVRLVTDANKGALVLDFFAGSGTTGHAVIDLNREDTEQRKYILVEMGEYFNSVTKPRIQKVIYSAEWKQGKPINRDTGVSHIMKYIRLESYEDALSNVELSDKGEQMHALFGEEYLINYMLDIESEGSLLKLDSFKTPFEYKLKVTERNETKEKVIDLVETFNYLKGLSVERQSVVAYFNSVSDELGAYEGAVRLVKDDGGCYAFKQVEGTLPDGRRALIIWRNITSNLIESNAALDAYFTKHRINPLDREFDVIYVNGDNNLENLRTDDESWKVRIIEIDFKKLMFEGV
jgi:adenine-specific DNA-methyltransferase